MTHSPATLLALTGLTGDSLTGYLAGLGVLRLLGEEDPATRLGWDAAPPHAARLAWPGTGTDEPVEAVLARSLRQRVAPLRLLPGASRMKDVTPAAYRAALDKALALPDPLLADLLGALGSDAAGRTDGPSLQDAPWCVLDGSQRRYLLDAVRQMQSLIPGAEEEDLGRLCATLFGPWPAVDVTASLCLEPSRRDHAYQWSKPSGKPLPAEGLANLLALVGLGWWPAVPALQQCEVRLDAACCTEGGRGQTAVTWPLWQAPLSAGTVRRLLLWPVREAAPEERTALGITGLYRAEIHRHAKGPRMFGAGQCVWRASGGG